MLEKLNALFSRLQNETANFNNHFDEPHFLENCMRIVQDGWHADFDDIESLRPFMITTNPIENLFIRRYLLKLLAEAYAAGRLKNYDPIWFEAAEKNLDDEFKRLTDETWSEALSRLEPAAVLVAVISYQIVFTERHTYSKLVNILLSTLPSLYFGMTTLNVMPSFSTFIRNNFFIGTAERQAALVGNTLYNAMATPHIHRRLRQNFWTNNTNRQQLEEIIPPASLLARLSDIHTDLAAQTQNLNSHLAEAGFVDHCFDLAENGYDERFELIPSLLPFRAEQDPIVSLLKRLYLLKLLQEANINTGRCQEIQTKLLAQLTEKLEQSLRTLRYQGHDIRTPHDLEALHRTGTTQFNRYQQWPTAAMFTMLEIIFSHSHLSRTSTTWMTSLIFTAYLFSMTRLYSQSSAGLRTLLFTDRAQQRFEQRGTALLNQPEFRNNFLPNGVALEIRRPRNTTDEEITLVGKNSVQTLLAGVSLMLLGSMTNGPRGLAFWAGMLLIAASMLYYNPSNMHQRKPR